MTTGSQVAIFDPTKTIAVLGAGVMGSKVALASAAAGIPTRIYDVDEARARETVRAAGEWGSAREWISPAASIEALVDGVQLVFENVPEDFSLKTRVLGEIGTLLAPDVLMGSNTSSMLCTPLADASGRPAQFFNMNFNDPLHSRLVELMGGAATTPETLRFASAWAEHMGLVVLQVRKEQLGYSHNRLWRVIKKEALRQLDQGIATPADIDRGWMLSYGGDAGPCGIMDAVGLGTVLAIERVYHAESGDPSDAPPPLLVRMVEEGKLGVQSGEGFYTYPDADFQRTDFLSPPGIGERR